MFAILTQSQQQSMFKKKENKKQIKRYEIKLQQQ